MRLGRPGGGIDRSTAERLLDRGRPSAAEPAGGAGRPVSDPLGLLLDAATGPARPGELAGEEAALTAFRAARVSAGRARRVRRRLTAGVTGWIAGIAATATAGVAFAAVTLDQVDDPPRPPGPDHSVSPGHTEPPPTRPGAPTPAPGQTSTPSPTGSGPSASPTTDSPLVNGRQWHGLCTAYLVKDQQGRAQVVQTPPYRPLVAALGGPAGVEAYCRAVVAVPPAEPSGNPAPSPVPPGPSPARPGPTATKENGRPGEGGAGRPGKPTGKPHGR